MTTESALERLGLDDRATAEEIEKTYRKLINRYPPEFHPEKFRRIDEAYRFLTSFARRVEALFSSHSAGPELDMGVFDFTPGDKTVLLEEGLREVRRLRRAGFLWDA